MARPHYSHAMKWPCRVSGITHLPSGRPVHLDRWVDGAGDLPGAVLAGLKKRKDGGKPFVGDSVRAVTPLGQTAIFVVEVDHEGELVLEKDQ